MEIRKAQDSPDLFVRETSCFGLPARIQKTDIFSRVFFQVAILDQPPEEA
jgi:hypothetical protein